MPIDPDTALRVILEGLVRFVIHDDAGVPIHWGREKRLFTGAAREAVMSLFHRCTHPGCRVRAGRCEADHLIDWQHGGETRPDNGGPPAAAATTDSATRASTSNAIASASGTRTAPTGPRFPDCCSTACLAAGLVGRPPTSVAIARWPTSASLRQLVRERPATSRSQMYDSMPIVARTASTKRRNSSAGTCPAESYR